MPVREFADDKGREWRAWDIRPEAIHPQTKAEDYLADCYVVGWIVFETKSGDEKRRLCPYPKRWADAPDFELRDMLGRATKVPPHKLDAERQTAGLATPAQAMVAHMASPEHEFDVTDLEVVRSFRYPGGRLWTVCVVAHPESGGPAALRFTAGIRSIDLKTWPKDWADAPDSLLVEMLRRAAPRRRAEHRSFDAPRRRWDD